MNLAPVLSLFGNRAADATPVIRDWSQQELAQFYRVQWVLQQAGISIECDRGVSDEGDPWFVFCRTTDSEVIVHIARERGVYVLAGFVFGSVERGNTLDDVINRLLSNAPLRTLEQREKSNVILHPATLLALIVSIAFFRQSDAAAAASHDLGPAIDMPAPTKAQGLARLSSQSTTTAPVQSVVIEVGQAMTLMRVVTVATNLAIGDVLLNLNLSPGAKAGSLPFQSDSELPAEVASAFSDRSSDGESQGGQATSYLSESGLLLKSSEDAESFLQTIATLWAKGSAAPDAQGIAEISSGFIESAPAGTPSQLSGDGLLRMSGPHGLAAGVDSEAATTDVSIVQPMVLAISVMPTSGSSMAKAVLKVTSPGLGSDMLLATSGDVATLYNTLSSIVSKAKLSMTSSSDAVKLHAAPTESAPELEQVHGSSGTDAGIVGTPSAEVHSPAEDKTVTLPFITTTSGRSITRTVTDDSALPFVERAIMAFKQDVQKFSLAIDGDDVIFYSPDALNARTEDLVVELWQFSDGSSIGLVGVDQGNHLPYTL